MCGSSSAPTGSALRTCRLASLGELPAPPGAKDRARHKCPTSAQHEVAPEGRDEAKATVRDTIGSTRHSTSGSKVSAMSSLGRRTTTKADDGASAPDRVPPSNAPFDGPSNSLEEAFRVGGNPE